MEEPVESQHDAGGWTGLSDQQSLVTFRLAEQTYALPIEPVVRIIEMVTIMPIPQVDDIVEGIINVHGKAVPVLNLRRHFGLPEAPLQLHTPIILVLFGGQMLGLIVDEVMDVLSLSSEQISRVSDILPEGLSEVPILQGLAHIQNEMVLLLNVEHLLSPGHVQALARAVATLPEGTVEGMPEDVEGAFETDSAVPWPEVVIEEMDGPAQGAEA